MADWSGITWLSDWSGITWLSEPRVPLSTVVTSVGVSIAVPAFWSTPAAARVADWSGITDHKVLTEFLEST